jgi:hypothetical protein
MLSTVFFNISISLEGEASILLEMERDFIVVKVRKDGKINE